jgi:dipeptidase
MCDTLVATQSDTADQSVWFAKNSDREPGEAQIVEHLPRQTHHDSRLQCTYLEIPQAAETYEVLLSRPFWMWGAEIGTNEYGVTIGNEAVWTKLPVEKTGLTGMDLLRLALERSTTAKEALELITSFLQQYGQGGACGYRNKNFRYHNSFIIADPAEAWVLETAGEHWAAERVRGIRTISNVLSIGKEFDLISDKAFSFAKEKGWCKSADEFDFAHCFGDPSYRRLTGGVERSACTLKSLTSAEEKLTRLHFFAVLREHNNLPPKKGMTIQMPCAHASWQPTRRAGQTTGSMVSCLNPVKPFHWLTGTSSPCLSIFKPMVLREGVIDTGATPGKGYDAESLFWRHERLHRLALKDYEHFKDRIDDAKTAMEARFMASSDTDITPQQCAEMWEEHRQAIPEWLNRIAKDSVKSSAYSLYHRYWSQQNKLDSIPADN